MSLSIRKSLRNKVKGRVVILDPKDDIAPKGPGFRAAYEQVYLGIVEYVPKAAIKEVDPVKKIIKTTAGEFKFADANLVPPHQAGGAHYNTLKAKDRKRRLRKPTLVHPSWEDKVKGMLKEF